MPRYTHPQSLVPRESLYCGTIYPPHSLVPGVRGDNVVTLYFHSPQYLVRGWLYPDIFSFPTIFGEGVIILWPYIFTRDNILWVDDYIVTLHFHSWQHLVRAWLQHNIIFLVPTIFGEGVIISWRYIFTPDNIWGGGDYIVTLHFHSWQYLVRVWLYHDILPPLTIFGEGVIISWHYIFIPENIWWGGDYIMTLYFHSWQYLVRGWLYRHLLFSLLTIFGEGGDYIVTLRFHSR